MTERIRKRKPDLGLIILSPATQATCEVEYSRKKNIRQKPKTTSYLPTDMTRVTPFYPIGKIRQEDQRIKCIRREHPWGSSEQTGWLLSIYDEDILSAVLAISLHHKALNFITTKSQICKVLKVQPNSQQYEAIWNSLARMSETAFKFQMKANGKLLGQRICHMLSLDRNWQVKNELRIALDPLFMESYKDGLITWFPLEERRAIRGAVAKAVYRAMLGEKSSRFYCSLTKICERINLETKDVPLFKLRDQLKKAFTELINKGHFSTAYIDEKDVCWIHKATKKVNGVIKDEHPEFTEKIKERWNNEIGNIPGTDRNENNIRLASIKIMDFLNDNSSRLTMFEEYKEPEKFLGFIFRALRYNKKSKLRTPHTGWLTKNNFYTETLPNFLESKGLFQKNQADKEAKKLNKSNMKT